jgi:hypothetical protein
VKMLKQTRRGHLEGIATKTKMPKKYAMIVRSRHVQLNLIIPKERKKAVKEEARERRKAKLPKSEKKRRIKQTSSKGR